jgi:CubicO group peptidase (beta-lactamase class C family)
VRLAALALCTVFVLRPAIQAQTGPEPALDAYISGAVAEWGEPGLSIAVVKDGKVALEKGYGMRGGSHDGAVDANTLFQIGSVTKAFTSAAIAMLVDERKIGWDTRVIDVLPDFRMYDPWVTREIRIRDLLCHRSGLPAFAGDMMAFGSTLSRGELVRRIRFLKPVSSFRTRYAYSNLMFVTAGAIVEATSGESWDEFVAARIFGPLGMGSTTSSAGALAASPNAARPFARVNGVNVPVERRNADNIAPAGGISSSAHDLARWILLQLGGGEFKGRQIFSKAASRQMWTVQMPIATRPEPDGSEPMFHGYGLGWNVSEYRGHKIVYHGGALIGMTSLVMMVPDEHLGVVVLTNGELPIQRSLARRVIDTYLGAPVRDWSSEALNRFRATEKAEAAKPQVAPTPATAIPAAECAGTYVSDALGELSIKAVNGRLAVSLPVLPRATGEAEPWRLDTWRVTWRDVTLPKTFLCFDVLPDGRVDAVKMRPDGQGDDSFDVDDYEFTRKRP